MFRQRRRRRAVLSRRAGTDAKLVAGLVETEGPGVMVRACVAAGRRRSVNRGAEGVEDLIGQAVEVFARPEADHGEPAATDVAGPVFAPREPRGHLEHALDVVGMPAPPLRVKVAGHLGHEKVQIGREDVLEEAPGDERPRPAPAQVCQTS